MLDRSVISKERQRLFDWSKAIVRSKESDDEKKTSRWRLKRTASE